MGFKGSWNKRNRLIEDLDTFLKLYKKTQRIYKKVRAVQHIPELYQKALEKYQQVWDEYRKVVNKKAWVDPKLWATIKRMNQTGDRKVIKTYSRDTTIIPEFVGHTIAVHNGKTFMPGLAANTLTFTLSAILSTTTFDIPAEAYLFFM